MVLLSKSLLTHLPAKIYYLLGRYCPDLILVLVRLSTWKLKLTVRRVIFLNISRNRFLNKGIEFCFKFVLIRANDTVYTTPSNGVNKMLVMVTS